ncbi:MAG: APC family permease [Paracoccus sp. (in: a-proteobacteria)]|uniref:APC family permease n=1 Tax=Paracoccus sp. TaxID=267 RepID=UPI0039E2209A
MHLHGAPCPPGGFYSFIGLGFGRRWGNAAAMAAIVGYNAMQIGLYGLFGVAAASLASDLLGLDLPWWLWSFLALASIAFFGYRQVDLPAKVLGLVVAGEYLVVLLLDLFILKGAPAGNITAAPFTLSALMSGAPAIGILFCFASFVGFEATTTYSEEAKNPERTIPLATYVSVLLIGGFYAFSTWCLVVGAGANEVVDRIAALPDPTLFTFELAEDFAGPWA